MTTPEKQKSDIGLVTFLMTVLKKSAELPEDVHMVASAVKVLSEEIKTLAAGVTKLTRTVYEHHVAITQILTVQEHILNQMKLDSLPSIPKNKSEKPN